MTQNILLRNPKTSPFVTYEWKEKIFAQIGYTPFGQQRPFHESQALHRIFLAGNQSGKTHAGAREVFTQLITPIYDERRDGWRATRGWVVVPRYSLADPIANELHFILQEFAGYTRVSQRQGLREPGTYLYSDKQHKFTITTPWGLSELWIKSADEPAALHAQPLDYILIDEAGLIPFEIYLVSLIPRLTVTGGWIAALGTAEDNIIGQWFIDFFNEGQIENERGIESFRHPTTCNPYVDEGWLEEQRQVYDPDLFAARFLAVPKPNERLVFPRFSFAEHVDRELATYDPNLPVYLGVDPGGIYAVIAAQVKYIEGRGDVVCIIDEVYDRKGGPTPSVIAECRSRPWWHNVGRVDRRSGGIDIANAESYKLWLAEGIPLQRKYRIRIEMGNDLLRSYIAHKRLVVNPRCKNILDEFRRYSYPMRTAAHETRARNPVDEYNHAIKATIYFIANVLGFFGKQPARKTIRRHRPLWGLGHTNRQDRTP